MILLLTAGLWLTGSCDFETTEIEEPMPENHKKDFAIALHGGAGVISRDIDPEVRDNYLSSLEEALTLGRDLLADGGSSLDAVEAVIRHMEDDDRFNAGRGAVFTSEEKHELDASIMSGFDLNAGAVTGVRTVKNPISLARKVMEESQHVMFAGDGAEQFADETNIERVANSYFSTERRREQLQQARDQAAVMLDHSGDSGLKGKRDRYSTVGVAALDRDGNLAAGTSTGGMTNKKPGRVGDSPVIAAGTYADNNSCAVSATGHGEKFIRNVVAYQICAIMEYQGLSLAEAARSVIHEKLDKGDGGIVAVDKQGNVTLEFSTPGMFRGAADSDGLFEVAIWD